MSPAFAKAQRTKQGCALLVVGPGQRSQDADIPARPGWISRFNLAPQNTLTFSFVLFTGTRDRVTGDKDYRGTSNSHRGEGTIRGIKAAGRLSVIDFNILVTF